MSDLLQVLLEHAERTSLPDLLYAHGYWSAARLSESHWEQFRKTLSAEQNDRPEALLEQETELQTKELKATFQSGVSLGPELSRLQLTSPRTRTRIPCR